VFNVSKELKRIEETLEHVVFALPFFKNALIKKKKNFLIYKEIQSGAVAKSYMTNGLIIQYMGKYLCISAYIRKPFLIYDFATAPL
jgi:hypothetical protein